MTTKVTSVTKQPGSVGLAEAPATVVVLLAGGVAAIQPANLIDTVGTIVIVEGAPQRSSAPGSGGNRSFTL